MFCMKCGAQNEDGAKFCTTCGAALNGVTWADSQDAPVSEPATEVAPVPTPAPEASAPEPAAEEATQVSESWGDPVNEVPPQEWPDAADQSPFQEYAQPKKGLGTGAIVGIIVGGIVVVALIVVAVLFATGTLSLGGAPDEPAKEESVGDEGNGEIEGFGEEIGALTGSGDEGGAGSAVEAGSLRGTVFDLASYASTPAEVDSFLQQVGLSLSDAYAFHYDDGSDSLYLDYEGTPNVAFPVEGGDGELHVSINIDAEEFDFAWDEDDYAGDLDIDFSALPEDCTVYSTNLNFEASLEPDAFAETLASMRDALGVSGEVGTLSATSSELADDAIALLGIDEDSCSISTYGDASYDCITAYYNSGYYLDITRYSSGDTSVSIGYSD